MKTSHLSFFLLFLISTTTATITLPLTQIPTTTTTPLNSYQNLHLLASASLSRAHRHTTALSPHSYGGYSITLGFGTPPQQSPFIFDTGSDFVWFPCTHTYQCKNCSSHLHSFIPKLSSSARILGCKNPKCAWVHPTSHPKSLCNVPNKFNSKSYLISQSLRKSLAKICPPYVIIYGSGSTAGLPLLETLNLDSKRVPEFLIGCSLVSSHQPAGMVGFGRGPSSLPSQLGLTKFSFCQLSHKFDESSKTTSLKLFFFDEKRTEGTKYTPFLNNPKVPTKSSYSVYYYLSLRKIEIGGIHVKIPYHYLSHADPVTGSGGVIVDSGTTFTYMIQAIYGPLAREFERQFLAKGMRRDPRTEEKTGLGLCFSGNETVSFPRMMWEFKGGAKMEMEMENYVKVVGKKACLTIVSDGVGMENGVVGPAVILGNFQMQNFYVEYDLKNQRFGFRKQKCG